MEKDYTPKHKPVEKDATMKKQALASTQKKQQPIQKEQPAQTPVHASQAPITTKPSQTHDNASPSSQKSETVASATPETKKPTTPKVKKETVTARGLSLSASKKVCLYIARYVRGKTIDQAIADLEDVRKYKKVVPYKGEIPHRSNPGVMSGRYPIKVAGMIIQVLKGLRGNAVVNGMDLHKTRITGGSASWASRPGKRGGARFKRTHITFTAQEKA